MLGPCPGLDIFYLVHMVFHLLEMCILKKKSTTALSPVSLKKIQGWGGERGAPTGLQLGLGSFLRRPGGCGSFLWATIACCSRASLLCRGEVARAPRSHAQWLCHHAPLRPSCAPRWQQHVARLPALRPHFPPIPGNPPSAVGYPSRPVGGRMPKPANQTLPGREGSQ